MEKCENMVKVRAQNLIKSKHTLYKRLYRSDLLKNVYKSLLDTRKNKIKVKT